MNNALQRPTWYFKLVDVPELINIQHEINEILPQLILPNTDLTFFYIKREVIENKVPSYVKLLDRLNVLDRWAYSAIVTTQYN